MHLDDADTDFATARVVVVLVPFDGTTCSQPGTREGPRAIIDASRNLELYDAELRRSPYHVGIHTLRAVEVVMGNAAAMVERTEQVTARLLDLGKFVVTLGGDHLTSIGVVRAFAQRFPTLSVLQIDAHADLRDEYEGSPLSAATVMRRVRDVCPRTAQVGIRSLSEPEAQLVAAQGLPLWLAADIHAQTRPGRRKGIGEVLAAPTYAGYVTVGGAGAAGDALSSVSSDGAAQPASADGALTMESSRSGASVGALLTTNGTESGGGASGAASSLTLSGTLSTSLCTAASGADGPKRTTASGAESCLSAGLSLWRPPRRTVRRRRRGRRSVR